MNDFTKEELNILHEFLDNACENYQEQDYVYELRDKIQSMIEDHQDEKEIYSCHTGLAVSDDFFCQQQSMTTDDLLPVLHQLVMQCDGMIRKSGIYAFNLRLVKIK